MENRFMSFEKFDATIDFVKETYGLTEDEATDIASKLVESLMELGLGNKETMSTQLALFAMLGTMLPESY